MLTRAAAEDLDRADPLGGHRDRFHLPPGVIYLDGNSLGAKPKAAAAGAQGVLGEWRHGLIRSWEEAGWWDLPVTVADGIARLVGAAPGQVVVGDTTTVNLAKALGAALDLRPEGAVLIEEGSFPTDRYVAGGVSRRSRRALRVIPRGAPVTEHLGGVAVAVLNHVDFRTAEILDLAATTAAVHGAGGMVVWDLCHSAGVLPVDLDRHQADFAVGCTYKYLNGGPGAPAYLYCASRHLAAAANPLPGWWSHADPFAMSAEYRPDPGVRRFLTGTPPIVSLRVLAAALEAYRDVDLAAVREKSMRLTDFFVTLLEQRLLEVEVVSPRDATRRGSQVTLRHPEAAALFPHLVAAGLQGDLRRPDLLRFGFAPLYNTYADAWDAVEVLSRVVDG